MALRNSSKHRKIGGPPNEERRNKILFVGHTALLGGAELALLRLIQEIDQKRFAVSVILFSNGPLFEALRKVGTEVEVIPLSERIVRTSRHEAAGTAVRVGAIWETLRYIYNLAAVIRREEYDVVHTNSLKAGLIGGIAARLVGCCFVWHLHDRIASDYMPSAVARVMTMFIHRLPNFLIANSHATLATVAPYKKTHCAVIYPGIRVDSQSSEPLRQSGRVLIGLVGRISRTKGQDIFLRAAAKVVTHYPAVRFQIIGGALFNEKAYEEEIHALVTFLGLESFVEFTGFVEDVEGLFSKLDMVVHASPIPEPFGQVAVEGMAAGKPVIATRAGGIPEIVVHEESGLLVAPGSADELADAICRLLGDPQLASKLAICARQRAIERFSIQRTAREIESIYERLIEPSAKNLSTSIALDSEHLAT